MTVGRGRRWEPSGIREQSLRDDPSGHFADGDF
jgi:hypothetical protein